MMKKTFHIVAGLLFNTIIAVAQTIPTGLSADSIYAKEIYSTNNTLEFFYYKPVSYDPLTSPLLFAIHGDGDNGTGSLGVLENMAERRKALVIAPNVGAGNFRNGEPVYNFWDTLSQPNADCESNGPTSEVFKQVYRHILAREKRASMPTYLIGFSAGGQFVTRYMLLRQAYPDSIPLRMAVSTNPYFYTFPTDTFNHVPMPWMCGLWFTGGFPYSDTMYIQYINKYCPMAFKIYDFGCREDIIQYYNENYAVLIGTGDTQNLYDTLCPCALVQGQTVTSGRRPFMLFATQMPFTWEQR